MNWHSPKVLHPETESNPLHIPLDKLQLNLYLSLPKHHFLVGLVPEDKALPYQVSFPSSLRNHRKETRQTDCRNHRILMKLAVDSVLNILSTMNDSYWHLTPILLGSANKKIGEPLDSCQVVWVYVRKKFRMYITLEFLYQNPPLLRLLHPIFSGCSAASCRCAHVKTCHGFAS